MSAITSHRIIERFNDSISAVKDALNYSKQQDINNAQKKLEQSATNIFQSAEWLAKNILQKKFADSSLYKNENDVIQGNNFHRKIDLLSNSVTPPPSSIGIDINIIKELKSSVRNEPEHSGFIPHYNSLRKVIQEVEKLLLNYLDKNAVIEKLPEPITGEFEIDSHWTDFYNACDGFIKKRNYILLIGPTNKISADKLKTLGLIDWSLIFDFNSETQKDGLYYNAANEISNNRKIHLYTCEDIVFSISSYYASYWIAANGLYDRSQTITTTIKEWNRKYHSFLSKFLMKYFQIVGDKPSTVIILWDDPHYVQKICETLDNIGGDKIHFVYAVPDVNNLSATSDVYVGDRISITLPKISDGILKIRNYFNPELDKEIITLPSRDEEYIVLEATDFFWIQEDLELIHRNILETTVSQSESNRTEFLKGRQITWPQLHLHYDIDREKTSQIKKRIEKELKDRNTVFLNLFHYPGIGGTTISKRIAWDLSKDYPVMLLKQYRPQETINKIYKVFELTRKPPLIIVDGSLTNSDEVERLFNEIRSRSFPSVLLLVQRRDNSASENRTTFYLPDILSDLEFKTFIEEYIRLRPDRKVALENLLKSRELKERHPFYLGLVAFEENFIGLQNFVERALKNATDTQKKIMSLISICHYYTQQSVSAQLFSNILMTSENKIIKLEEYLGNGLIHLLINEQEINWRPIHYLVAQELLKQILSGGVNQKDIWRQNLPDLAIYLIETIANQSSIPSENETQLLNRLFVYRDNQEILGKEDEKLFSNLIGEGIISDEARLRIFKQLTVSFPEGSHYWAHLARFYYIKMKDHEAALLCITKAIELSENEDSLLYHIKGMCLRSKVYGLFDEWRNNKSCPREVLEEITSLIEDSGTNFEKCRELNRLNDHGYISHVQLIIGLLDFYFSISRTSNRADFLKQLNEWQREQLDLAEELLDQVKRISDVKGPNNYITTCNLKLEEIYENYSVVIEGWNNLLATPNISKPLIRRQIIRAYVRRAKSWESLDKKDTEKILKLIESNIEEEPSEGKNIYLWFMAARQSGRVDVNTTIDKVSNWRSNSESFEAIYYLGLLHTMQAIGGTSLSTLKAEQLIRELSEKSRTLPFRTHCFEWYGKGSGLKKLIPNKEAVYKDENYEIKILEEKLEMVKGKISFIKGPESGKIELASGLEAFFIPARGEGFSKDRDINRDVEFYLGFSYDGLRAWNVIGK